MNTEEKYKKLKANLKEMGNLVVGFSGGVDSTFLLRVAVDVLGKENVLAVTSRSETHPGASLDEAMDLSDQIGVNHKIIYTEELKDKNFAKNDEKRCYYCKRILFDNIIKYASEQGFDHVADGSNFDDSQSDYRPGRKAIAELGVHSPLEEVEMTKDEIRHLSKKLGLPTWDKPSFACLATRFPYGEKITGEKLKMVGKGEDFLKKFNFNQLRLRQHDKMTGRIEVNPADMKIVIENRQEIVNKLKEIGYNYVTLDIEGYRTGSMNEVLM